MSTLAIAPSPNGDAEAQPTDELREQVDAYAANLRGKLAEVDQEIEFHRKRIEHLAHQRKWLGAILRATDGGGGVGRPKTRAKSVKRVPAASLLTVLDAVLALKDDKFTALGLHQSMGEPWKDTHTYHLLTALVKSEVIGRTGQRDPRTRRHIMRVLDHEAGARLRAELQEKVS